MIVVHNERIEAMAKILIVDDDKDLLDLMGESLDSAGLDHDMATSAKQALDLLNRSEYDLVISDYNMPGETGLDLLRYVSSRYPETPFLMWTAYDDPRIKRDAMRLGIHAYIQKPFYMNDLRQTIINLIRRDDQQEAPAA